jgi:hypothetical protein
MEKNIIDRLFELGTTPQGTKEHNQIARLINKIGSFVILIITPHTLLTFYFRSTLATLVQLTTIFAVGFTIFLNSKHFFNLSRIFALLIGNFHIFAMVLIFGLKCGVYFSFPAAIIAPMFFYTLKELKYILFFGALTIMTALSTQLLGVYLDPLVGSPVKLITIFFYFSLAGSLLLVFLFVLHFYIELQKAHDEVSILSGLLPICSSCKNIRDDKGFWTQVESYIRDHSEAEFTHSICPTCAKKLYSNMIKKY